MPSPYEFEFSEPRASRCECCGGLTVKLTRFVHRDGSAFAIYYATYSNNHDHNELHMIISLGEWGEDSTPSQRAAFYCRVRPTEDSYQVMLDDAAESPWGTANIIGEKLTRDQARAHAWKATAFEVLDEAFVQDRSLRGFLDRVHCGDAAVPLEFGYGAPDEIAELKPDERSRANTQKRFAILDENRFFVRCLLAVPIESYGSWCVGLWVETSKTDFDECKAAWDDTVRYPALRFSGRVANDVHRNLDLPVSLGNEVAIHVRDMNQSPYVEASSVAELSALLSRTWTKAEFEEFAVARGLL